MHALMWRIAALGRTVQFWGRYVNVQIFYTQKKDVQYR